MSTSFSYKNDKELLRQLHRGNKRAFETLYNRNYTSVFYFARRFVSDQQAAEDITTETFLKLWNRLADFDSLETMRSFLHVTVRNACLNHLRDTERKSARHEQFEYLLKQDNEDALAEQQLNARIYEHIYDEIEKLSPQLKNVFTMAYIEGLSNEEIAQRLGINNQSVRNDKSRALKQIRLSVIDKNLYSFFLFWLLVPYYYYYCCYSGQA